MMRKILLFAFLLLLQFHLLAVNSFRFVLITDLHIQMENNAAENDLLLVIEDINQQNDIDFVLVAGDVTEYGDKPSLEKVKTMLNTLKMPYYITMGNHDQKLSEPAYDFFNNVFGDNKFSFSHKGFHFVGFASRPAIVGGNGIVDKEDISWVEMKFSVLPDSVGIIAVTHYPLQAGDVDNWRDMVDVLKKYKTVTVLGGHYHRNVLFSYDGIPGIINRSTLKNGENICGYSIYSVSDSLYVAEKQPGNAEILLFSLSFDKEDIVSEEVVKIKKEIPKKRPCIFRRKIKKLTNK